MTRKITTAAVDAAARAIHAEGWTCEAHEPEGLDACEQCATSTPRLAHAALAAALPLLTAAPSATRDEVYATALAASHVTITDSPYQKPEWLGITDALLARFNITPKETDR